MTNVAEDFERDGVVCIRQALPPDLMTLAESCFDWSLAHPSPAAQHYYGESGARFYQDLFNTLSWPVYAPLVADPRLAEPVRALLDSRNLWFFFEQIFLKEGGYSRRTPWHQDTSYFPVDGSDLVVMWMSLDPVARADALEFVRGSHRQTLFNGSGFRADDDTAPLYDEAEMPRLPDIEADRDAYDIVGWDMMPGDVLLFHPSILHGGGAVRPGNRRRTLSLRYFGDDCKFVRRPTVSTESSVGFNRQESDSKDVSYFYEGLKVGDDFRHPDFLHIFS